MSVNQENIAAFELLQNLCEIVTQSLVIWKEIRKQF